MALAINIPPLDGAIRWRHDLVVSAERNTNRDECGSQTRTLGDLLYADKAKVRAFREGLGWAGPGRCCRRPACAAFALRADVPNRFYIDRADNQQSGNG